MFGEFVWWQGVVEDRVDPLKLGRCRVRILGYHTDNKVEGVGIPTEHLPWATPSQPITSAAMNGIGTTPMGPVEGTWVFGFFRDGKNAQEPVMMSTFGGRPEAVANPKVGFNEWFSFNHCGDYPPLSNSEVETRSAGVVRTSHAPSSEVNAYPTTDEKNLNNMIDSKIEFYPKHDQMYAQNANDLYNNQVERWKLRRNAHIGIYDCTTILLEVSGNSAIRVGQIVTVILPSPETTSKDKKSDVADDKYLSGKYMVTAIQHMFGRESDTDPRITYNMKIEVMKDGLEKEVVIRKPREG